MDSTTVGSPPTGAAAPPRRRLAVGLCVAVVAVAFEAISVATAMPAAARELDGLDLYAWAFSLFLIGQLFATIAAGRLCDRIGPARPMAGGLTIFGVGLVVAATAPTMVQLVAARLLQGLGAGVVGVAMYVVIAQAFDVRRRPAMFSWISSAWVVPSFVGPTVAAWLTHHLDWRAVFWAVIPLLLLGSAMMLPPVFRVADAPPPNRESSARPAALWAAGLAAVGATAVQLGGQRASVSGLLIGIVGLVMVGAALPNLMPRGFFRFGHGLPPVIVVRALIAGAFFGAEAFVPLMLVEQRHLSLLLAGSTLTVGALGWSAGAWLQSLKSLRLGRERIITLGATSVFLGVGMVALVAWLQLPVVRGGGRVALRRARHGAGDVRHLAGDDDAVARRRPGPQRVVAAVRRGVRRRPVHRGRRHDLRRAAPHRRPHRDVHGRARGDDRGRPAGGAGVAADGSDPRGSR